MKDDNKRYIEDRLNVMEDMDHEFVGELKED